MNLLLVAVLIAVHVFAATSYVQIPIDTTVSTFRNTKAQDLVNNEVNSVLMLCNNGILQSYIV